MNWMLGSIKGMPHELERLRRIGWYQAYYSLTSIERIESGSPIDELLNGGIALGSVVDVFGENGVGKTQLSFQLCVEGARRGLKGEDPRPLLFVDACGTFRPERVQEIAELRGVEGVLDRVMVKEVRGLEEQGRLIDELYKRAGLFQLIVFDTITENFMAGEASFEERAEFSRQLLELGFVALKGRTAILLTNTVRVRLETGELVETAERVMRQNVHIRIRMSKVDGLRARLVEPDLGVEVKYSIGRGGIASAL